MLGNSETLDGRRPVNDGMECCENDEADPVFVNLRPAIWRRGMASYLGALLSALNIQANPYTYTKGDKILKNFSFG